MKPDIFGTGEPIVPPPTHALPGPPARRTPKKRVRIIKKIRLANGVWKFVSLKRAGSRYLWDRRPGHYFLEWWEGQKRRREYAGDTPSDALEAQRRKRNELIGQMVSGDSGFRQMDTISSGTTITEAANLFEEHVRIHSPSKPRTLERYKEVLAHLERLLGNKKYVEAITRSDIDDYKMARTRETVGRQHRPVSPATVNFEVTVLKTFFYYMIRERGISMENPCARSKPLRVEKERLKRRPPTYTTVETDKLITASDGMNRAIFATLLLAGLRKGELTYLTWSDVDLDDANLRLTAKDGFAPKDYEEREIPLPPDLVDILHRLPQDSTWVFSSRKGKRLGRNEILRRLKNVAERAGVKHATLHKFRHTYATRLLEDGCDIVTLQHLLGHSDLKTTRKYLSPDHERARRAVNRLSLTAPSRK
jgi:integrase